MEKKTRAEELEEEVTNWIDRNVISSSSKLSRTDVIDVLKGIEEHCREWRAQLEREQRAEDDG